MKAVENDDGSISVIPDPGDPGGPIIILPGPPPDLDPDKFAVQFAGWWIQLG